MSEEFWGNLLRHIRHQVLMPVVGPDVTLVTTGDCEKTLDSVIGQRLAATYGLDVSPEMTTTDAAVSAYLNAHGRDYVDDLYGAIDDIILDLDPAPGKALRDLAAIDDFRVFISTTPDRMLARAVNEVRFDGEQETREIPFSPLKSTPELEEISQRATQADTVVLNLFGQTASTPEYAIHEEDRLEWIHALLTEPTSLPDWLDYQLKNRPMLFIGCEIPDWFGRFLLRLSSDKRLSLRDNPFFFVSTKRDPALEKFFATYCRSSLVRQLEMEPAEFAAELRRRWEERRPKSPPVRPAAAGASTHVVRDKSEIFISYMREDASAAERLCKAIEDLGGSVWLDKNRLSPGAAFDTEIMTAIQGRGVRLFVPIISANTEREDEGYVFQEWRAALKRSRGIMGRSFIVPVVVDEDYAGDPTQFRRLPRDFMDFDFGCAPAGAPDERLLKMLTHEIRAMRKPDAA
jgi:TIR domain-containing protein